jgi:hypothetical protein
MHDLPGLLDEQMGLVSVAQLLDSGLTRSAVRARLRREWCYVLPRVISTTRGALTEDQRLVAALLFAGEGAVVASLTAATWHGVRAARLDRLVRVVIPANRHVRGTGFVVVTRTTRPDAGTWARGPLVISSPARSVADAAREAGADAARALVIEAMQRRLVGPGQLRHELIAGPHAGSTGLREALAEAEKGAWSVPEADLARLVAASSILPPMLANPVLTVNGARLPTPDGWFDDVGLAVQVHSRQFHAGELDWEATVASDGIFAEHGIPLIAVTPRQIATEPTAVVRRTENAYLAAKARPRPPVTALIASAA